MYLLQFLITVSYFLPYTGFEYNDNNKIKKLESFNQIVDGF